MSTAMLYYPIRDSHSPTPGPFPSLNTCGFEIPLESQPFKLASGVSDALYRQTERSWTPHTIWYKNIYTELISFQAFHSPRPVHRF